MSSLFILFLPRDSLNNIGARPTVLRMFKTDVKCRRNGKQMNEKQVLLDITEIPLN
jgi:hypothetical protein